VTSRATAVFAVAIAVIVLGVSARRSPQAQGPPSRPVAEPAPRLADGTPNLGRVPGEKGVWNVPYIQNMGMRIPGADGMTAATRPAAARAAGSGPVGGGEGPTGGGRAGSKAEPDVPFMPWSRAIYDYNSRNNSKYDPEGYCLPPGGPRLMATPYPMEILQQPEHKRIFMVFEGAAHVWREIYMDGRPHPTGDELNPTYLGHSVGRWEGDTLVVDIVGFNENTWLDYYGHPHTDRLHVVERFSRPTKGRLRYEALIDDPGAYTRPWTVAWDVPWRVNAELSEYICQENNRYLQRLTDDLGQPVFGSK
jgi:hypothetical protein